MKYWKVETWPCGGHTHGRPPITSQAPTPDICLSSYNPLSFDHLIRKESTFITLPKKNSKKAKIKHVL